MKMLLELSEQELDEIQDLHQLFDTGIFCLNDDIVSLSIKLDDENVNEDVESVGVYSYILQIYHDGIDVKSIDEVERTQIKDTLIATKEFFRSIGGSIIDCRTLEKLLGYFGS